VKRNCIRRTAHTAVEPTDAIMVGEPIVFIIYILVYCMIVIIFIMRMEEDILGAILVKTFALFTVSDDIEIISNSLIVRPGIMNITSCREGKYCGGACLFIIKYILKNRQNNVCAYRMK
jgi:hypothetical protein